MTCEQWRDLMPEFVLGVLDTEEHAALRVHLGTGCPQCAGALAEAQATVAMLAASIPPVEPSAGLRDRLMNELSAAAANEPASMTIPMRPRSNMSRLAIAASFLLLVGAGLVVWTMNRSSARDIQELHARLAERESTIDELQALVASEQVKLVQLTSAPQGQAGGRVFWDRARGTWHLYVFNLSSPGADKTYELWFITADGKKVPAGTFDVDARGAGSLKVSLPTNIGQIALAAITDEPTGGVPQPTGTIRLSGPVQ